MFKGHCEEEAKKLDLLKELLPLLRTALYSLGGQTWESPQAAYVGYAVKQVNYAADGFFHLRIAGRVYASKLLVRPVVESAIAVKAVLEKEGVFFQLAFTETRKEEKQFATTDTERSAFRKQIEDLKQELRRLNPACPIIEKQIKIKDLAEAAGMLPVYESSYQLYCKYSHGTLRALTNELDDVTDPIDTQTVIWGVLQSLDALKQHTPANVPVLEPFKKRLLDFRR